MQADRQKMKVRPLSAVHDIEGALPQELPCLQTKLQGLPNRAPATSVIQRHRRSQGVIPNAVVTERISTLPVLHPEQVDFVSATAQAIGDFENPPFAASLNVRINRVVNVRNFHAGRNW